jgi:hypothetical protein
VAILATLRKASELHLELGLGIEHRMGAIGRAARFFAGGSQGSDLLCILAMRAAWRRSILFIPWAANLSKPESRHPK